MWGGRRRTGLVIPVPLVYRQLLDDFLFFPFS